MINKIFIIIISLFLLQNISNFTYAVDPNEIMINKKYEKRARNISKNIRCMVCQNQSIDDSNSTLAKDLRILIRDEIKNGKNDDEIYNFLTKRYGDFILLKPPLNLSTLALWFLPFTFLIIGFLVLYLYNKKYKKN